MGSSVRGNKCYYATSNFFLTAVSKNDQEQVNILNSFNGEMPFFIGSEPRLYSFRGGLLNTTDFDWARSWYVNWQKYLAGSTTSTNNARFYILYGGRLLSGHLVDFQLQEAATRPYICDMSFTAFIIESIPLPRMVYEDSTGSYVLSDNGRYIDKVILDKNSGDEYARPGLTLDESTRALYSVSEYTDEEFPSMADPPEKFDPPPAGNDDEEEEEE